MRFLLRGGVHRENSYTQSQGLIRGCFRRQYGLWNAKKSLAVFAPMCGADSVDMTTD